jgi:hypothetical protein
MMILKCKKKQLGLYISLLGIFLISHNQNCAENTQSAKSSYVISDGSRFAAKAYYPKFSWDVAPQYFMFGTGARLLEPEEVEFIADRTNFICIEKAHGFEPLGAAELGAKHEAAAFKKLKPDAKVLFYFNSAHAYPFTSYTKGFSAKQIDQHPEYKEFLLVDTETGELARRGDVFFFDVLNPEFREWWANAVAQGVEDSDCDGAFIDQMHGFAWMRPSKSEAVAEAMGEMMASLKKKMGPNKILLGNNTHQYIGRHVFPVVDANMIEHYNGKVTLSKESLFQDWEDMLRFAKAGKMTIFRIGVEQDSSSPQNNDEPKAIGGRSEEQLAALSQDRLEYYLACFLIGAQPYSYFQYGWGWELSSGSLHHFALLQKRLGPPKGAYVRESPNGWVFTRGFEHASVWVDTEAGQAKISWK